MEVLNAVRGPLANCPKVLFAARFVQPIAVAGTAILLLTTYKDAFGDNGRLWKRCRLVGITVCAISNVVLLFPMAKWIKAISIIFSVLSWEFFTTAAYPKGLFATENLTEVRKKFTPANILWPIVGVISSIVMALGAGSIITMSPAVFDLAAFGLFIESLIKYGNALCYDVRTGNVHFNKKNILFTVVLVLCQMVLALLYIGPFMGIPLHWFINLLLCCLSVLGSAIGYALAFAIKDSYL